MASSENSPETEPPCPYTFDLPDPPIFATSVELTQKLEEAWKAIRETSLDPVFESKAQDPFLSVDLVQSLHMGPGQIAVKDICMRWKCEDERDFKTTDYLNKRLEEYFTIQCKALCPEIQKVRKGEALLRTAFMKTKKLWTIISYIADLFTYLQPGETEQPSRYALNIRRMTRKCYYTEVYYKISQRLRRFALESLEYFRMGENRLFRSLLQHKALIDSIGHKDERFIEREWNLHLRKNCIASVIRCKDHLKKRCLCHFIKNLDKRRFEIQSFSVGQGNLRAFRNEILRHAEEFFFVDNGNPTIHLLEKRCHKALRSMCSTFRNNQEFMRKVANIFEKHLSETVIVEFKESLGENPTDSHIFVEFLKLWSKVTIFAKNGLSGHENEKCVAESLSNPFNSLITKYERILRCHLERYFDDVLRGKSAGRSFMKHKTLSEEIESAVVLLEKLPNFEAFVDTFKKKLAKSLPCENISPKNAELVLKPFTDRFLYLDAVAKLKGFMSIITKQEENNAAFTPKISGRNKQRTTHPVGFLGAKVVQKVDWPEERTVEMKLPECMKQMTDMYDKFFELKHQQKLFEYNFSSDRVVVSTTLFARGNRNIKLHMSTHQACILELFQKEDSLSVSQIQEMLKADCESEDEHNETGFQEMLSKYLRSLMTQQFPLLQKTPESSEFNMEDILSLNKEFTAKTRNVILPKP